MYNTIKAKKSLGQNFLNNPRIAEKMVVVAELSPHDTVLEIGPGTGALTEVILNAGALVVAVETDARACEVLRERFADAIQQEKLTLIHADIRDYLRTELHELPPSYAVIANIPYYLSGFLLRSLIEHNHHPRTIVFLTQKELAERIARDKKESLLSLSVKAYGDPRYVGTVKKGNFSPAPKVDSAIIAIHNISRSRFNRVSQEYFFNLLHAGFAGKRKQLLGALAPSYGGRDCVAAALTTIGARETVRGEDLSIDQWMTLAERLS